MSSGSGAGSDPHLLGLLRAIRLRQNAPEALASGSADTSAALSEVSLRENDPEEIERHPGADRDRSTTSTGSHSGGSGSRSADASSGSGTGTGSGSAGADAGSEGRPGAGVADAGQSRPGGAPSADSTETGEDPMQDYNDVFPSQAASHHNLMPPAATRPAAPPPPEPGPLRPVPSRPTSEILWRGDPNATLGRSGLEPGTPTRRRGASGMSPRSGWGPLGGVNPISGMSPSGPTAPMTPIPPHAAPRRIGSAGTDFPSDPMGPLPGRPYDPPPMRKAPGSDGMDPADDAALRDTQRLLSTSLTFAGGTEDVAERLWAALLQAQPDLLSAIPGTPETQRAQLARALTWLAHNLGNPPIVVAGCGQLGAALAECGVRWTQLHLVGAALAEAMRAGMAAGAWRQDFDHAWRWAWQHTYEWIMHGGTLVAYQPTIWGAEVVAHELRRPDLAVIRLRPYLPMPFQPGQYTRVQVGSVPGVWRPYSPAGAPSLDDILELHVRARADGGVSDVLVHGIRPGDRVELSRAEGSMGLPSEPGRSILMIAGDTGVAPMKGMLAELAAASDPRSVVLFWGVRELDELYDIDAVTEIAHAAPHATVVPVIAEGDSGPYASGQLMRAVAAYGDWSRHEVYVAGPPLMLAATTAALEGLGVAAARIHRDVPE